MPFLYGLVIFPESRSGGSDAMYLTRHRGNNVESELFGLVLIEIIVDGSERSLLIADRDGLSHLLDLVDSYAAAELVGKNYAFGQQWGFAK